jgi:hypothetical protein
MGENLEKAKAFAEKYDRSIGIGAMTLGFTVDSLTLTRIDQWLDNLILLSYLSLAGLTILLLNIFPNRLFTTWLPFVLQYAFGGLFSGFIIFYSRSASLIASWPFLLILAIVLLGNEFFRKRYRRTAFQLSIYYTAVFSFTIFYVPIFVKEISDQVFILSGIASLLVIGLFLRLLLMTSKGISRSIYLAKISILGIFILFNTLYFTNLIPPIPLSLKEFDIYYSIERSGDTYRALEENVPWYRFQDKNIFKYTPNSSLFAFSAVFAPTDIKSDIVHEWSSYNPITGSWEVRDTIKYPITGGRDGGYRGYSSKNQLENGRWRVDVKNRRGQILGRKKFTVVEQALPVLSEKKL